MLARTNRFRKGCLQFVSKDHALTFTHSATLTQMRMAAANLVTDAPTHTHTHTHAHTHAEGHPAGKQTGLVESRHVQMLKRMPVKAYGNQSWRNLALAWSQTKELPFQLQMGTKAVTSLAESRPAVCSTGAVCKRLTDSFTSQLKFNPTARVRMGDPIWVCLENY